MNSKKKIRISFFFINKGHYSKNYFTLVIYRANSATILVIPFMVIKEMSWKVINPND